MRVILPVIVRSHDPQLVVIAPPAAALLQRVIKSTARPRDGGKSAAPKLRKLVKTKSKRADFLRWFLDDPTGRTVGACMANFEMTRQNVFAYWTAIHRDHGIGYAFSNNTITAILPGKCEASAIFGARNGA